MATDCCNFVIINNEVFGHKIAQRFAWCSDDGKAAYFVGYVIVNWTLAGSIQDAWLYRSAVIMVKGRDDALVVSRVNLKLKL